AFDNILVELIRGGDAHIRKARVVKHSPSALGEVGEVTAVEADGDEAMATGFHFVCHLDRIGHAALEGAVGVDEQNTVVGSGFREIPECCQFIAEALDQRVGHGPRSRNVIVHCGCHVARRVEPADDASTRGMITTQALCSSQAEVHKDRVTGNMTNTCSFCGDQRLKVQQIEQECLYELRFEDAGFYPQHGYGGKNHLTFLSGIDGSPETPVAQMGDVVGLEFVATQKFKILLGEAETLEDIKEITESGKQRIASSIWKLAEEVVEDSAVIVNARLKINLPHGDLVEVGIAGGQVGLKYHGAIVIAGYNITIQANRYPIPKRPS